MTVSPKLSARAETLAKRLGLSYDDLLGFRFAVNVLLATTIVWFMLRKVGDSNAIWAIASMVAEVKFGCVVGVLVSCLMSKVWLVRRPKERASVG